MKHSFKESYDVLQRHANTLRTQNEPNIDDLLRIVEESVAAYKNCQARIDAVEKALDKALGQLDSSAEDERYAAPVDSTQSAQEAKPARIPKETAANGPTPKPPPARAPSGFDDMDDDIPF